MPLTPLYQLGAGLGSMARGIPYAIGQAASMPKRAIDYAIEAGQAAPPIIGQGIAELSAGFKGIPPAPSSIEDLLNQEKAGPPTSQIAQAPAPATPEPPSGIEEFLRKQEEFKRLSPPRGQVSATVNGKTYDYAQGESIPDIEKGRLGPMTEPAYGGTEGGLTAMGQRQYGGQGGHGSASMVELSNDSTTPMADQLRQEQLQRTVLAGAQAEATARASDPFGAEAARRSAIEVAAAKQRGQSTIEQAVAQKEMVAAAIDHQERAEHAEIDSQASRDLAMLLNQLHMTPQFQNADQGQRMMMEQQARSGMAAHVEQLKREASVSVYARYGINRSPTLAAADPNGLQVGQQR